MAVAIKGRRGYLCDHEGCAKPHVLGDRFCFDHLDPDELEAALAEPDDDEDLEERVQRLERATAPSAPVEVTAMPKMETELQCTDCGKPFKYPGALARHALNCTGKAARSGRIAAAAPAASPQPADRTPPATKRRAVPVSPPQLRSKKRKSSVPRRKAKSKRAVLPARKAARRSPRKRTQPAVAAAAGVTPAQMIAALRVERDKIDAAIASIEALA